MKPIDILNIVLHVMFISTFICIFFFTLGSKLEKMVLQKQIKLLVKELFGSFTSVIPGELKDYLKQYDVTIDKNNDQVVEEKNKKLLEKVVKVVSGFIVVCLSISYYLVKKNNISYDSLKEVIKNNLIILVFVGLTYGTFASTAALNFRTADSNFVRRTLLEQIKEKLSKH